MSFRPVPLKNLSEAQAQRSSSIEGDAGFLPNSLLTMAKRPAFLEAATQMIGYLWGSDIRIDPQLTAMVAYMSSLGAGCKYCQAHSVHYAYNRGVNKEKLQDLWKFESSEHFDSRERAALAFALAAGQVPNAVQETHFEELTKYFDEDQILDLVAIVSIFGFANRWNDTIGTALETQPILIAKDILSQGGWSAGKHEDNGPQ